MLARLQNIHGIVANAPKKIQLVGSDPLLSPRLFTGFGVPSGTSLQTGNGLYCGSGNGSIIEGTLAAAGSGYVVGNVLTAGGGTPTTAAQFTVDGVSGAGAITDWHLSRVGAYTVYPTINPAPVTGGAGSGATFNLAVQPPDFYFDFTGQKLYICITAGSKTTSTWVAISGDLSTVPNWI